MMPQSKPNLLNRIMRLFLRKEQEATADKAIEVTEPKSAEDYLRRGWRLHGGEKREEEAERDFRKAISLNPNLVEGYYGLGLVLKAQGRYREAAEMFQQAYDLIERGLISDKTRAQIMRRLTYAHLNMIKSGDWGLEKEIWKHTR